MQNVPGGRNLLHVMAGRALARYIRLVVASARIRRDPPDLERRLLALQPCIVALWHGQFFMVPGVCPPAFKTRIMVARHGDAEVLGVALERFGMSLIRGAGAGGRARDRGGAIALRAALRTLREGENVAMTADVPPGPARRAGLGIVTLARLSGRPIVPVAVATARYAALDTWSRLTLNLPFTGLGIAIGEPISVPRDADEARLETLRRRVEDAMNAATARAYALAGGDAARATPPSLDGAPAPIALGNPKRPSLALRAYGAATSALQPLAPLILSRRERLRKEDPARRSERFGMASLSRPSGDLVWFHAASVGETNAILPVIEALLRTRPALHALLTTGTVTSATLARRRLSARALHQFVPLDAPDYVRRFLDHWRPSAAVFVESEIWPNLLLETAGRDVPLVLANGRMTKKSFRMWRRAGRMARPLFAALDMVLAQDEETATRFLRLGARRAVAVGNLKMDCPPPPVDAKARARLEAAVAGRALFLAASTHAGEEEIIAQAHRRLARALPRLLTIVVPRHPERGAVIAEDLTGLGLSVSIRSAGTLPRAQDDVYVADTIGEIGLFYALADVAFIGGSLVAHGGQNPIEAVKLGAIPITGPHWGNFKQAYGALLREGGAMQVVSAVEMAEAVGALLADPQRCEKMRAHGAAVVSALSGALERTLAELGALLPAGDDEELKRAS